MTRLHATSLAVVVATTLIHPSLGSAQPAKGAAPATSTQPVSSTQPGPSAQPAPSAQPTSSAQPAPTAPAAPLSPSEEAGRTFQQGREAFKSEQFDRALELFRKSYALEPTPGVLLNIALAEEKLGKPAAAFQHFERVVETLPPDDDRLPIARDGVARTTLRAPRLKIARAAGAPPTLAVTLDGEPLDANLIGAEQPVEPGPHVLTTRVFGFDERRYEVTLAEGQRLSIAVEPGKRTLVAVPVVAAPSAPSPARLAAFTLGGVGLASLGVGAVTGILAVAKKSELDAKRAEPGCSGNAACKAAVDRLDGEGLGLANVSTGTLIFGGVAAAAGVVVFLTTGGGPVSVGASAGPGGVSLSATGKF